MREPKKRSKGHIARVMKSRGKVSGRVRDSVGAWTYTDSDEHLFAFELSVLAHLDLPSFDAFLEQTGGWSTEVARSNRQDLLRLRADARAAYEAGDVELM